LARLKSKLKQTDAFLKGGPDVNFDRVKRIATQYLLLTVFVAGIISTFTVLENPGVQEQAATSPSTRLLSKERAPASLGAGLRMSDYPVEIVEWDCHQERVLLNAATQVRLRLHPCQKTENESLSTKVTNTTTGFAATVFKGGERADLTTDFITLVGGINRIHIEHILKNGKHTARDLSIVTN
jgi:hypothetical protein